jgi:hypothetical protein
MEGFEPSTSCLEDRHSRSAELHPVLFNHPLVLSPTPHDTAEEVRVVRERTIRSGCAAKEEIEVGCQMLDVSE